MSQYPSPYQPHSPYVPGYSYPQMQSDLRGPARRAGVLMGALGALMLLLGVCCVGLGSFIDMSKLPAESRAQFQQLESQMAQAGISFSGIFLALGAVAGFAGVLLVLLAIFVYRGGIGAVMTGIVVAALCILALAVFSVLIAIQAAATRQPAAMAGICIYVVPLALFVLLLIWLIQAARRAPQIAAFKDQQQAQMWQYQQMQQAYGQPGGYGYPQQAAAPQQPPPPTPPQNPAQGGSHGNPPAA